ncbi:sulfurtransferase [Virgibacillus sp. NKC19-3]|uniref:sulfurtransferase n=1 Tax=Virgibacillus saliphilus TaxID=2831674 RepID=UPI001C9AB10C|nr:sulfurtransferase [Virgibacillus sp. NKC19-3]MBY7142217.1 sulfurtransferase [Virgibacillus sp. NKC19-3]
MTYLISVNRLKKRLENNQRNTVIVDVRFQLDDPDAGRKMYLENHLPGAVYMDLNKDLADRAQKHGGKHPLPDMDMFTAKIGKIGIDHQTSVVIYDQENDMFAARLWWLLHYLGHEKAYVLDGGYARWVAEGNDVTDEIPILEEKDFHPAVRENQIADIEEVKEKLEENAAVLIDSRAKDRYLGKTEPLYVKAGHIPGARNFFWKDVLTEKGSWKKKEELQTHFESLPKDKEIIVSCGSGISACPNVLALKAAGYTNVKLYPGSFSDWISYEENEVAMGEA